MKITVQSIKKVVYEQFGLEKEHKELKPKDAGRMYTTGYETVLRGVGVHTNKYTGNIEVSFHYSCYTKSNVDKYADMLKDLGYDITTEFAKIIIHK